MDTSSNIQADHSVTPQSGHDDVVAIDGPVGVGKSSVARKLANMLAFRYLDTGAMYRLVIWKAFEKQPDAEKWTDDFLIRISEDLPVQIEPGGHIFHDGKEVGQEIRNEDISKNVFRAADLKTVRANLVKRQQELGLESPSVLEGRDITTVVFPNAKWKFYLDASPRTRATRRMMQYREKGHDVPFEKIMANLRERDRKDRERETGGLRIATDAIVVDTTAMTEQMVIELMADHVRYSRHWS